MRRILCEQMTLPHSDDSVRTWQTRITPGTAHALGDTHTLFEDRNTLTHV